MGQKVLRAQTPGLISRPAHALCCVPHKGRVWMSSAPGFPPRQPHVTATRPASDVTRPGTLNVHVFNRCRIQFSCISTTPNETLCFIL